MSLLDDLAFCIGFFSRLPWPHRAGAAAPFRRAVRVLPFAAMVIALPAAVTLWAGGWLGLPPPVIALLALAVLVLSTGALHEDGLADCADGFGGGVTRERKLAIMKDSRIGTYGVAALALSLLLRAALLAALLAHGPLPAAMALLAAASVSRVACLLPLRLLPPARVDGLGAGLGRPDPLGMPAALSAGLAGLLLLPTGFAKASILLAVGLAPVAGLTVTALARRMIGGQTGDVAGAAQQLSEIAFMLALLISRP